MLITCLIHRAHPDLYAFGPFLSCTTYAGCGTKNTEIQDVLHAPFAEDLDGGIGGTAGRDDGVDEDGGVSGEIVWGGCG